MTDAQKLVAAYRQMPPLSNPARFCASLVKGLAPNGHPSNGIKSFRCADGSRFIFRQSGNEVWACPA